MATHTYEITVIGGGPVGMFAAFYAGLHSADVLLLESLAELGGQPGNLYPAKILYDIGGYPNISGQALITQLKTQVTHFHPSIHTATNVLAITPTPTGFTLETTTGTYTTKAVIIATGGGAFTPRKLAVDYDPALEPEHIQYFVQDLEEMRGLDVAIAGGGDSAIDWALALEPIAKSVHLIHRRNQFRGLESSVAKLQASSVTCHTPFLIDAVTAEADRINVALKEVRGDRQTSLNVDKLLVNYGFVSENKQLRQWGVALKHNAVTVNSQMATSIPGIYAIGDAVTYPGKLKLIASGFGEAPIAINEALTYLYPDRRQATHSTQLYH
ncbi:NAD(P)/FAD-dependent oxidoreductase [Lacticaseibacillus baoqingensis]|uniref:Ferredoxin--NADP reductase n=1 Tax=Lacticaseibacillus baoqingensis TaxID=2486013 RepID=A0ABW4E8N0_9LACO|nr:NAD(P)/FAD-dependent oxidoreductase [Lacticaseibacillus baoqingensis]